MSKTRFALGDFQDPKNVRSAIEKGDHEGLSMIKGALGAIAEGSRVDKRDESTAASAQRYGRMLDGAKDQGKLSEKDYPKIAELIHGFITGPKRTFRTTPRKAAYMNPTDLADTLIEIAEYLESVKSPSRTQVASAIEDVIVKVAFSGIESMELSFDAGPAAANNLVECVLDLGVSSDGTLKQSLASEAKSLVDSIKDNAEQIAFLDLLQKASTSEEVEELATDHDIDLIPKLRSILKDAGVLTIPGQDEILVTIVVNPDGEAYWSGVDKKVDFNKLQDWFDVSTSDFEQARERKETEIKSRIMKSKV